MKLGGFDVIDARQPDGQWPAIGSIDGIAIHHSVSDRDTNPSNDAAGVESIRAYHTQTHGWPGIGYHAVIGDDGTIFYVGGISLQRAHVAVENDHLLGICLLGDYSQVLPPPAQIMGCARCIVAMRKATNLHGLIFKGHKEWARPGQGTACPGDMWPSYRDDLDLAVAAVEGGPHPMLEMSRSTAVGLMRSQLIAMKKGHADAEALFRAQWGFAFNLHSWVLPPELQ